jgi:hypothetical protein
VLLSTFDLFIEKLWHWWLFIDPSWCNLYFIKWWTIQLAWILGELLPVKYCLKIIHLNVILIQFKFLFFGNYRFYFFGWLFYFVSLNINNTIWGRIWHYWSHSIHLCYVLNVLRLSNLGDLFELMKSDWLRFTFEPW